MASTPTPRRPAATRPRPQRAGDSFGRVFLTEMFVNMALVILILVTTAIGLGVGGAFGDEVAPLTGVVVGAARRLRDRALALRPPARAEPVDQPAAATSATTSSAHPQLRVTPAPPCP